MSIYSDHACGALSDEEFENECRKENTKDIMNAIADTWVECTDPKCEECRNAMPVIDGESGEIVKRVCMLTRFQATACLRGRLDKFEAWPVPTFIDVDELKEKVTDLRLVDVDDPEAAVNGVIDEIVEQETCDWCEQKFDRHGKFYLDRSCICWLCFKKQQLKDTRDWEDE